MPLLGTSLLTPSSIPNVSRLLTELISTLRQIYAEGHPLTVSLISYVFFPLSSILQRNASQAIPDQILEKIFLILSILCETWWWDCDLALWEQMFMLSGAVIGGIEGKGKGKDRDDETKEAAAKCLLSLLRRRGPDEDMAGDPTRSETRLAELRARAQTSKFIPVLGQTLNSLLLTVESSHRPLKRLSLQLLQALITEYLPDNFVPSVLPGVVSAMSKVALGISDGKGWANGETVAGALGVMQEVILKSIGDNICLKEGAVRHFDSLEDFAELDSQPESSSQTDTPRAYSTIRNATWLRGTSSQLHIAMNALNPLVAHPTPSALLALSRFSSEILAGTFLTLPQSQTLLLSFLLSLSNSTFSSVSLESHNSLIQLLSPPSSTRHSLLQTLMQTTRDNMTSLPRLIPSQADAKVEHIAGLIEAVCRLTTSTESTGLSSISAGIGKLLGPTGGIEKWGWSLLSVLVFVNPPVVVSRTSSAQLMFENDSGSSSQWVHFPEVTFKNVSSRNAHDALVRMFNSLGKAGGDNCLFSVEWFASVSRNGRGASSVAALWCACRILEGVGDVFLTPEDHAGPVRRMQSKRLEKLARGLARSIAESWDDIDESAQSEEPLKSDHDDQLPVQHVKGLEPVHPMLKIGRPSRVPQVTPSQPMLHRSFSLQLISIAAGILQARFTPLLLYTLYPVLHSLVSPASHLSSTALATLNFITISTSYASPANLLLSNFDYALDAVSRRLTRRWLDVDATKVLVVLVRLVGSDVVEKAGDVVEECFDRLDEFHGYQVIVEGLVEVLGEVVKVIETDDETKNNVAGSDLSPSTSQLTDEQRLDAFFEWLPRRHDLSSTEEDEVEDDKGKSKAVEEEPEQQEGAQQPDMDGDPPPTPMQALTKQIVSRSLYFLTHDSPIIRARILALLSASVPVLPEHALLPSVHHAWPYVLNRLSDPEPFVISAAASLVEALVTHVGSFMFRRIWDDVWPRFRVMLNKLDAADASNALARRGPGSVGTESAYTHSHRLYRSLMKTMTAAVMGVDPQDSSIWQVLLAFRRFLHQHAHPELQESAIQLYKAISTNNEDAVWLALYSTLGKTGPTMTFLEETKWDIKRNVEVILQCNLS